MFIYEFFQLFFVENMVESLVYHSLLFFINFLLFLLGFLLLLQVVLPFVFEVEIPRNKYVLFLEFSLLLLKCPDVN